MPDTYTPNTGMDLMAYNDASWNTTLNGVISQIDSFCAIGCLAVRPKEIPSASLNVSVSPGPYVALSGAIANFAGNATFAMTASSTNRVYLTGAGTLSVSTSAFPTGVAYVPLAVVVSGSSTITSVTPANCPAMIVGVPTGGTLVNAASDSAAASGGVLVGGFYRNGNAVQVRLT